MCLKSPPSPSVGTLGIVFLMEIKIDRNEEKLEVKRIMIFTKNKEFTIYIDKFGELIVNKEQYGNEESGIIVRPKVSNEIGVS